MERNRKKYSWYSVSSGAYLMDSTIKQCEKFIGNNFTTPFVTAFMDGDTPYICYIADKTFPMLYRGEQITTK